MTEITTAITSLFTIVTSVITAVTTNTWLVIPFVAVLIGVAIKVVKKLKRV